ncbi:hypothetical protein GCM10010435_91850 [Winogradskya consettensis]|uniref:Uncharacterized protein n=1 Tax=Winogradskya consettensis TaxID=113560 RepID=A0A919SYP2_9ACTN|nr:hypothetical protein Aco04nite_76310 [Actinoplanes consettensis]
MPIIGPAIDDHTVNAWTAMNGLQSGGSGQLVAALLDPITADEPPLRRPACRSAPCPPLPACLPDCGPAPACLPDCGPARLRACPSVCRQPVPPTRARIRENRATSCFTKPTSHAPCPYGLTPSCALRPNGARSLP